MFKQGFALFFPLAALWSAGSMAVWLSVMTNRATIDLYPHWHAHELLFGYSSAVLAGFLLTAIPNWTKRPPLNVTVVAGLCALWLTGRVAMLDALPVEQTAIGVLDSAFLFVLTGFAGR